MRILFKACRWLAVALVFATGSDGLAQSQTQSAPTPGQPQTAPAAKPQPEQTAQPAKRQRPTKKAPRKSKRVPAAGAQGSSRQPRTSRDAGPTRHELSLTANLVAGRDDNLTAGSGTGEGISPRAMASGSTQSLDAALSYFYGNTARSIRMASTGSVLAYPDYLKRPAAGGVATIDATTTLGRSWTLRASERAGYEPLFNVFSSGGSTLPLAPGIAQTVPATGLFEYRSRSSVSSASIDRQWSGADRTSLSYAYGVQRFTAARGDNTWHDVRMDYRRRLTRVIAARAAYGYVDREYTDNLGARRPIREHRIEGGPDIEKVFSRRRRLTLSLGAGASYSESVGLMTRERYQAWVPIGSASATLVISSVVSVDGGYRRGFSLLQGLTDEVYTTDTAFLTTRLLVTRRTDVRVSGTFSNWQTALTPGITDRLRVYGASLQLNVPLTARVAATASYNYYQQHYSNPAQLPVGFPAAYDRQAFRVGLTMWVPLAGTSASSPLTAR